MGIDSARREEPKTGLPAQIGHQEGIPAQWSPKSPYVYLQYTTQSVCPHIPPGAALLAKQPKPRAVQNGKLEEGVPPLLESRLQTGRNASSSFVVVSPTGS